MGARTGRRFALLAGLGVAALVFVSGIYWKEIASGYERWCVERARRLLRELRAGKEDPGRLAEIHHLLGRTAGAQALLSEYLLLFESTYSRAPNIRGNASGSSCPSDIVPQPIAQLEGGSLVPRLLGGSFFCSLSWADGTTYSNDVYMTVDESASVMKLQSLFGHILGREVTLPEYQGLRFKVVASRHPTSCTYVCSIRRPSTATATAKAKRSRS